MKTVTNATKSTVPNIDAVTVKPALAKSQAIKPKIIAIANPIH